MGPSCYWPEISQVSYQGCAKFSGPRGFISWGEAALVTVSIISFGPFATKVLGFPQSHGSLPLSWYAVLNTLLIYCPLVQLEILLDHSSPHVPLGAVGFYPPLSLTQQVYSASVFPWFLLYFSCSFASFPGVYEMDVWDGDEMRWVFDLLHHP